MLYCISRDPNPKAHTMTQDFQLDWLTRKRLHALAQW
jgi:hypothetical protein